MRRRPCGLDSRTLPKLKEAGVDHTIEDLPGLLHSTLLLALSMHSRSRFGCRDAHSTRNCCHISRFILARHRQDRGEFLLGSPLLEALGLSTRDILAAAVEKHTGAVDVPTIFRTNSEVAQDGRISGALGCTCHADGGADDADFDDNDDWLDLGREYRAEKEIALKQRLSEARAKGIFEKGATSLDELLPGVRRRYKAETRWW